MRVNWVFSAKHSIGPEYDINAIKNIGATWGSWKSWRACSTDNVICHDQAKAQELLQRAFQSICNFYIPKKYYQDLGRPMGVQLYEGDFAEIVDDLEDIIAMYLASANSDLVLLSGFNFGTQPPAPDRLTQHRIQNRMGLFYRIVSASPKVQWVLVDHSGDLDQAYTKLPNLTCDKMQNVLKSLSV